MICCHSHAIAAASFKGHCEPQLLRFHSNSFDPWECLALMFLTWMECQAPGSGPAWPCCWNRLRRDSADGMYASVYVFLPLFVPCFLNKIVNNIFPESNKKNNWKGCTLGTLSTSLLRIPSSHIPVPKRLMSFLP